MVLRYEGVGFRYPDRDVLALDGVSLAVEPGAFVAVAGASGSGKSTLLRCANGLVPHSSGGRFRGTVTVAGRSTADHRPRDLVDVVGFVHQDPEAQFVVDHVETDLAFALENLGVAPTAMRRRVEEVLDALGIAGLRDRDPATLSGGERQRCAIAGALAAAPAVLVLDEPTSQLDPQGAEDVLGAIARLNQELGTMILVAEHRLDRVVPIADRVLLVDRGHIGADGAPETVLADYPGAPAVMRLGRALHLDPLPTTVKAARSALHDLSLGPIPDGAGAPPLGDVVLSARGTCVRFGAREVLRAVDLDLHRGEVVALLGRNGAGKTTFLRALAGLIAHRGAVQRTTRVGYVPQDPNTLLGAATVRDELLTTVRMTRQDPAAIGAWLERLGLAPLAERHPRDLSSGERQRLAIAAVAVGGSSVLLLDEPTRGMDAPSRAALASAVTAHARDGGSVVLATHDVELAAMVAGRVLVLGDGALVADGPAREVLAGSLFAPAVLRVLPGFLTVDEVLAAR